MFRFRRPVATQLTLQNVSRELLRLATSAGRSGQADKVVRCIDVAPDFRCAKHPD
jgi:hypothetical protein